MVVSEPQSTSAENSKFATFFAQGLEPTTQREVTTCIAVRSSTVSVWGGVHARLGGLKFLQALLQLCYSYRAALSWFSLWPKHRSPQPGPVPKSKTGTNFSVDAGLYLALARTQRNEGPLLFVAVFSAHAVVSDPHNHKHGQVVNPSRSFTPLVLDAGEAPERAEQVHGGEPRPQVESSASEQRSGSKRG